MMNSDLKNTGPNDRVTAMRTLEKQTPGTTKKAVLADVQNANRNLTHNHQEGSLFAERRPFADSVKFSGTKRPLPEFSSVHPFCQNPTLSNAAPKEHLTYANNKFEIQQQRERFTNSAVNYSEFRQFSNMQQQVPQKQTQRRKSNLNYVAAVTPYHMAPKMTLPKVPPSLPNFLGKHSSGVKASERNCVKASLESPHVTNSKRADDRQWDERYIRLQNSLKRCDESDNSDLVQRLCQLSPAELNMYAFELERKAIQLAFEEGKEMQRMKALNIFQKSPTIDPMQTTKLSKSMK